ncbi:MAG: GNAT family N-acetyltransferase [Erysipelotrichaceae bacterium]|nr:GNAT family N-acetyltransferase [Erysipelotrichaceae bacterium]
MKLRLLKDHEIKNIQNIDTENVLLLVKQGYLIMIGSFAEELIGYIGIYDLYRIDYLYIDKKYRHRGIGRQLVDLAKKYALNDLIVKNHPFFEHIGFIKENDYNIYHCNVDKRFTSYQQVQNFIASQKNRVYALTNFQHFMNDMVNPQLLLKCIHIGGTNGKGSTTNYLSSVLQKEGYKVASFTSPALVSRLDIMRINHTSIDEETIIQYANRYMQLWLDYELSMFEIEVFIAIMYFISQHVDYALFEVGLGGELDATNIITPLIAVNTNIGLDHTEYLGDTYEKIAQTKGGIIKDNVPFITAEKKQECIHVFQSICDRHHSSLLRLEPLNNIHLEQKKVIYDYKNYHVTLNTSALYQSSNSALALDILLYLRDNGYIHLSDENLLEGLYEAKWLGRFETVNEKPLMIIDGAHNKEGMQAFYESAKYYNNIKVIFSALRDKDTHAMIELLLKLTDDVTICEFDHYRAQSAQKLAEDFPVKIEKDWHKAIDEAFQHEGVVFITGSLYFLSQVRPYILSYILSKK